MAELPLSAKEGFDEVMRFYSDTVYRLAFSRTGNSHDADDILQEVFLKYIRTGKTYKDEEHRKAWLIRVTVNAAKNLAASAWKRRTGSELDENRGETDKNLARIETESVVYPAVMSLPPKYRTVIHLFYYEDMPLVQVCKATGLGENTVKSLLRRARALLKEKLGDFTEGGDNFDG